MYCFLSPPHGALMGTFIRTRDIKRKGVDSKQNKLQGDKEGKSILPPKRDSLAKLCTTQPWDGLS